MDSRKPVETQDVSEEKKSMERADAVKLIELGDVSVETKGNLRGLEYSFLPKG